MFGSLGGMEMLVLVGIGLLVFGPRRLPEIGRTLGRTIMEFRRAAMEVRTSIEREINLEELRQTGETLRHDIQKDAMAVVREDRPVKPSAPAPPPGTVAAGPAPLPPSPDGTGVPGAGPPAKRDVAPES
jgi:sec-independent protein translocase protein TatA